MIQILKDSGFCFGVSAAVHTAEAQIKRLALGERVYLYGDLVNNRHVMARLKNAGLVVAETSAEIPEGSVVIIRAHGVSRKIIEDLKNAEIIDCTCPKVKSIHKIVAKKSASGSSIIIAGKHNHPEVMGILGRCETGTVVDTLQELEAVLTEISAPICVVAQTTCSKNFWEKAVAKVKINFPEAQIFNTLCNVTEKRTENAVELAKTSDCMVVVGDKKSANSVELYNACAAVCKHVFFVSSTEEITGEISNFKKIGIVGSASAPAETIEEIHDFLHFAAYHSQSKAEIETACNAYLQGLQDAKKEDSFVANAIRDFNIQNQNGKRVRGTLIKLGAEISQKPPEVLKVAMAYEIFATAILIHDDIIDKSDTRRGKATIHASKADAHFGMSRAICIGDYGLFLANKILAESGLEPEILVKVMRLFSEIQLKTLEGEILDVTLPVYPVQIPQEYDKYSKIVNEIYEYKTAWYTLAGPLMLGAICSGASGEMLEKLRETALPLGFAYQIKDDLLGIFANEKTLGKPALSDIIEKKQTILYGYAINNATSEQKEILEKCYGNPLADEKSLETVRKIFTETGAKKFAENEINRLSEISLKFIDTFDEEHRQLLRGLVHFLINRRH